MKRSIRLAIVLTSMYLTVACTPESAKLEADEEPDEFIDFSVEPLDTIVEEDAPSPTYNKDGKILNLVRVMEGGACKNKQEGVEGLFLLYADPDDVERIKVSQGAQVFGDFEREIETIAATALQETINGIYVAGNSLFPDSPTVQQSLVSEFSLQFADTIENAIEAFRDKTTLMIDIVPFGPSLYFYSDGCTIDSEKNEN
ncbi:MAG: hypothetical protein Kow0065_24240 [Methylomicrobium sp.]